VARGFVRCVMGALGALAIVIAAQTPARACKGATTLFRDDFTDVDPAWGLTDQNQAQIGGGAMSVTTEPNHYRFFYYQGQNFAAADACVDVVFPTAPSKFSQGGLGFWNGRFWDFVYIQPDGQAGVTGVQNGFWVNPAPPRRADSIKTTPGAANRLRVVWKAPPEPNANVSTDPTVEVYINDNLFVKFKTPPNLDRSIAIYADTEGLTYQFKNLIVTQ